MVNKLHIKKNQESNENMLNEHIDLLQQMNQLDLGGKFDKIYNIEAN